jgi:hypothetical protein
MATQNYEILNKSEFWAIIGIVIGFLLAEFSALIKKFYEQKECKKALIEEIRFNHNQTEQKIDVLNQSIESLREEKYLKLTCATYSTIEFDNLYHKAIPTLEPLEKDNLRFFNSFYKTIDHILRTFDQEFKCDLDNCDKRNIPMKEIYESAITQLEDVRKSLVSSLDLSGALLKGSPKPIFVNETGEIMQFNDNSIKGLFDNVRNFFIASTVIACGVLIFKNDSIPWKVMYHHVLGGYTIFIGFVLLGINIVHGWKKMASLELNKISLFCLYLLYALFSIEVVIQLWSLKIK